MYFMFENSCKSTEVLVTALKYDAAKSMYELTVLGIDKYNINYIYPGQVWLNSSEFKEIMMDGDFELPQEIVGKKLKLAVDIV